MEAGGAARCRRREPPCPNPGYRYSSGEPAGMVPVSHRSTAAGRYRTCRPMSRHGGPAPSRRQRRRVDRSTWSSSAASCSSTGPHRRPSVRSSWCTRSAVPQPRPIRPGDSSLPRPRPDGLMVGLDPVVGVPIGQISGPASSRPQPTGPTARVLFSQLGRGNKRSTRAGRQGRRVPTTSCAPRIGVMHHPTTSHTRRTQDL
jgi:hypothetical protein